MKADLPQNLVLNPYRIDNWILQGTSGEVVGNGLLALQETSFDQICTAVRLDTMKAMQAGTVSNTFATNVSTMIEEMKKIRVR